MTDLGRSARELIDLAAKADSAPATHYPYGRTRLVARLAAGAVTTAAVVAKGAVLGASGAATGTTSIAGTTSSLVATLVSAVTIGLSTGLVVVSPATRISESPRAEQRAIAVDASATAARAPIAANARRVLPQASAPTPSMPLLEASSAVAAPFEASRVVAGAAEAETVAAAPSEAQSVLVASSEAKSAVAAPSKPTRASIARETALLAEAQRALTSGRAMMALDALDRYAEQCPAGLLQEEATVSRVLALCAVGRVQDARRWADEFLRRYPTSPLLPRIRNACNTANPRTAEAASSND